MQDPSLPGMTSPPSRLPPGADSICEEFSAVWRSGHPPRIEDFLSAIPTMDGITPCRTLIAELVMMDLEFRWRGNPYKASQGGDVLESRAETSAREDTLPDRPLPDRPLLEDYVCRYPVLGPIEQLSPEWIAYEYYVRMRWGDGPQREEYLRRFATQSDALCSALSEIEQRVAADSRHLAPALHTLPRKLGRFELVAMLGKGAMGRVYRAIDPALDRAVAVKIPHPDLLVEAETLQRFLREARAAAQLRHPNLVPVYEAGQADSVPYITSQYVEGQTLRARLQSGWRPDAKAAAELVRALAEALHYAHGKGIIHRDIKPENVIIDVAEQPLLMDFGLARREEPNLLRTEEHIRLGTLSYMSPEQARGESHLADARSDLWSLGVVFYELLTGTRPFTGSEPEVLRKIAEQEPRPPQELERSVPRDVAAICMKCLDKDPDRRYPSCQHLAEELQRWLHGEPTQTRPPGRAERLRLWGRRRPLVAALTALSAMLALTILVGGPLWAVRETLLRRQADAAVEAARLSLSEKNFQAARLAGERGQWRLALEDLDEAMHNNYPDPVLIALEKIKAFEVLGEHASWAAEIDNLSQSDDLAGHRAEVLMCQAALLRSQGQEEKGLQRVRQALEQELPAAEAAYARALLAETSPAAVRELEQSLREDPFHHRATVDLVGLLFCLGRRAEARQRAEAAVHVFPEDPCFPAWLAMIAALEGDQPKARAWLELGRKQLTSADAKLLDALVALLERLGELDLGAPNTMAQAQGILVEGLRVLPASQFLSTAGLALLGARPAAPRITPSRLTVARSAKRAGALLTEALTPSFSALLARDHNQHVERLGEAARIHPEGTLLLLQGLLLAKDGRWRESEQVCARAARTAALLPRVSRRASYHAAEAAGMLYLQEVAKQESKRSGKQHLERMLEHIRQFAAQGRPTPGEAASLCQVAMPAKQYDLARQLVNEALRARPEDLGLLELRVHIESLDALQSLEKANATLRRDPSNVRAKGLRDMILRQINNTAKNGRNEK